MKIKKNIFGGGGESGGGRSGGSCLGGQDRCERISEVLVKNI